MPEEIPTFEVECPGCHYKNLVKLLTPRVYNATVLVQLYFVQDIRPECEGCHQFEFRMAIAGVQLAGPSVFAVPVHWVAFPIDEKKVVVVPPNALAKLVV